MIIDNNPHVTSTKCKPKKVAAVTHVFNGFDGFAVIFQIHPTSDQSRMEATVLEISERPEPWDVWRHFSSGGIGSGEPTYLSVPIDIVLDLIEDRGLRRHL